ncbi:MAG TPA: hypothetical protein VFG15_20880, partial [Amycolatopsis sp.]|nr:hypothetical protein [Amycolatopsis sp.]
TYAWMDNMYFQAEDACVKPDHVCFQPDHGAEPEPGVFAPQSRVFGLQSRVFRAWTRESRHLPKRNKGKQHHASKQSRDRAIHPLRLHGRCVVIHPCGSAEMPADPLRGFEGDAWRSTPAAPRATPANSLP